MCRQRPQYPYESFFYAFDELGERPSTERIRQAYPAGLRRLHAFRHFSNIHPDAAQYLCGYLESAAENGVYDDSQFAHCFGLIERALELPDAGDAHHRLRKLDSDLHLQQAELLAELGPERLDEPPNETSDVLFKAGRYGAIESRFTELQRTVKPRGILGGEMEKEYWRLYQYRIRIPFKQQEPEAGIREMDAYERGRIAVKLTPIPDFDVQETVIGYLAQQSVANAVKRLVHWLNNSRMPIINDVIKYHPGFRPLFEA